MRSPSLLILLGALVGSTAHAQDEPIDIDVGSERIGGRGVTERERRAVEEYEEEEEYATEDNIPPAGNKKRLPHLHVLAKRSATSRMWTDACARYDQIIEEAGDEGLDATADGKKLAARSYLECAEAEATINKFDRAERLLKKSEKYGPSDHRHAAVRKTALREDYRNKMLKGDVDGAVAAFETYQRAHGDENERIWLGEKIAGLASEAYKAKDKVALEKYLRLGDQIAPMNTELRALKDKVHTEATVLGNVAIAGAASLVLLGIFLQLGKWWSRRKVAAFTGGKTSASKNKFIDDEP